MLPIIGSLLAIVAQATPPPWHSVTLGNSLCEFPEVCGAVEGFTVYSSGEYSLKNNQAPRYPITESELQTVDELVVRLIGAAAAPIGYPNCTTTAAAQEFYSIVAATAPPPSSLIPIQDGSPSPAGGFTVCNYSNPADADALKSQLDALEAKYSPY
jgi:hypothetical protein